MAGLKEIKNRIASISSTVQITAAMKMVSAAKLKKAQDAVVDMRAYANKMQEILQNVSANLGGDVGSAFISQREVANVLLVVISSNRGLCGAFNSAVIKETVSLTTEKYADCNVDIITIGKKANDILAKRFSVIAEYNDLYDDLTFDRTSKIAENFMQLFIQKTYDSVEIVYNQFKNAATAILTVESVLPVIPPMVEGGSSKSDYIFEPNKAEIVAEMIPKTIKIQLFKAVLDSLAAEHGSRMTAMHKATDNATDMKNELMLSYNKARQAAITGEILEIVGGAEALS